ncbi:MAG: glycosyltransferase family 4 protein [Methanobacteriota archaeon]|nr:MAG: glycosyltransferase family 4 protein [Euryarchaeota archaeon]
MNADVRVGVLTPYGPQVVGGVEVFNEGLRRAFGDVEIFANTGNHGPQSRADLRRVGLDQPVGAVHAARALLRRHREEPFNVILSNGVSGWPLTIARPGVPLVQVYHNTMAGFARRALSLRGDRFTTGRVMGLFDRLAGIGKHVVGVSQPVLREVESLYGFRGRLIPNAVDTEAFKPANPGPERAHLGIPREAKVGLFVGRPNRTKGYDILLRVAEALPDVEFLVVGGRQGTTGNVQSLGPIAHGDMPRVYAASDFFFLPSRYEGLSLSLLEALSCDLPVVVSEAAWPFDEEPLTCGAVVPGDGERGFVDAIRYVLGDPQKFSPRAFVVRRYNLDVFQETWRNFVEALLGMGS